MNIQLKKRLPRIGLVGMTFPGYFLGEEMASSKFEDFYRNLQTLELDILKYPEIVDSRESASKAGKELAKEKIDAICVVLTTFIPDHFIVDLLQNIDIPIFLWAIEREIDCLSLVGGMLINPTLFELKKQYMLFAEEIGNEDGCVQMMIFMRTAMIQNELRNLKVGYMGGNPDIMFSIAVDENGLKKVFGVSVVPYGGIEYYEKQKEVSQELAEKDWEEIKFTVGQVRASDVDGVNASAGFLAMKKFISDSKINALSINCWPHLKAKVCLPIARLNDLGCGAGCEGDLHSTIIMRLLYQLSGRAAINGDFLRLFSKNDDNDILFSHCGAGSFSMARSRKDILLDESIETHDGIAVFFPADQPGNVTAVNLMGSGDHYRIAVMTGDVQPTDLTYKGTPMRIRFKSPVKDILQNSVKCGAGHHWSIAYGNFSKEFELYCKWHNIQFSILSY